VVVPEADSVVVEAEEGDKINPKKKAEQKVDFSPFFFLAYFVFIQVSL
jgi:hypothetical protein